MSEELQGNVQGFQATDDVTQQHQDSLQQGETGEQTQPDAGADKGGERLYTKDDVSRMIQGRLSDDKHKKIVEKIAKRAGVPVDELEGRLDALEQEANQQQMQETARDFGVHPTVLTALASQNAEITRLKTQAEIKDMLHNKKEYPDFSEIQDQVVEKAKETNLPLEEAYWIIAGRNRVQQSAREAEHRMQNQSQKKAGKDRIQGDASSSFGTTGDKIPDDVVAMAQSIGEDPQDYWDSMNSKDIDEYRSRKSKRKK